MKGSALATRTFALRTEPHEAVIGDTTLLFRPEVIGAEFLDAYERLQEVQRGVGKSNLDVEQARLATAALREFLADLMLPESAAVFGEMQLPDRILVQLLEWVGELYGSAGGEETRPTGRSTGSAPRSPSRGTRGKASSPSRG